MTEHEAADGNTSASDVYNTVVMADGPQGQGAVEKPGPGWTPSGHELNRGGVGRKSDKQTALEYGRARRPMKPGGPARVKQVSLFAGGRMQRDRPKDHRGSGVVRRR